MRCAADSPCWASACSSRCRVATRSTSCWRRTTRGDPRDQLDDPTLANVLVNSVIRALTEAYGDPIIWDAAASSRTSTCRDQLAKRRTWASASCRTTPARRTRCTARSSGSASWPTASRPGSRRCWKPNEDRRMALVLAYGGYAYVFMGEILCDATINVGSKRYTPEELVRDRDREVPGAIAVAGRREQRRRREVPRLHGAWPVRRSASAEQGSRHGRRVGGAV